MVTKFKLKTLRKDKVDARVFLFCVLLFFLFFSAVFARAKENLKAPFILENIQLEWGYKKPAEFSCNYPPYGHIPVPIKAVELEDYYIDEYGSKIDPKKYKTYQGVDGCYW